MPYAEATVENIEKMGRDTMHAKWRDEPENPWNVSEKAMYEALPEMGKRLMHRMNGEITFFIMSSPTFSITPQDSSAIFERVGPEYFDPETRQWR